MIKRDYFLCAEAYSNETKTLIWNNYMHFSVRSFLPQSVRALRRALADIEKQCMESGNTNFRIQVTAFNRV